MNYQNPNLQGKKRHLKACNYVVLYACRVCEAFVSLAFISSLAPKFLLKDCSHSFDWPVQK